MIVKSLFFGIFLFLVANTYLLVGSPLSATFFPSPKATNQVILDRAFLDYSYQNKAVLVGSSITNTLGHCQDHRFVNLGLLGKGNLDGLTILSNIKETPKVVFVEINQNVRALSFEVLNYHVSNKSWLYKYFPIFSRDKNLVSLFVSNINDEVKSQQRVKKNYDELVNEFVKTTRIMGTEKENIDKLYSLVALLQKRGSKVVLIEYPVDKRLSDTLAYQENRRLLKEKFPGFKIIQSENGDYKTTDGVHLSANAAKSFCVEVLKLLL